MLLEGVPTLSISGEVYKRTVGPCIYGWKRSNSWLYIGCSTKGLQRVMAKNHEALSVRPMEDTDEIIIWFPPEGKKKVVLRLMEQALIEYHKPLYNDQHKNFMNPRNEAKPLLLVAKALSKAGGQ